MQAIRTIQKPTSGELTIQIPEEFINQEVEIIILLPQQVSDNQDQVAEHTERYLIAQQFKGDALYPDYPTDELNVYEQ
ncbi:MAG: hypothetical protein IPJ74_00770 [Saprospiraceae bacterium]|nr:hypothetical protein [Saprospiraceae bacterium]